jgi:hypothetical protein
MTEPRIIATIDARNGYDGLIAMFRARIVELETHMEAVDEVAGLPTRYTGKLLDIQIKDVNQRSTNLGRDSLGPLLGALGLKLAVLVDETADYKIKRGLNGLRKRGTKGPNLSKPNTKPAYAEFGRLGRAKFLMVSSAKQRSMTARIAACARWQRHRAKQAKLARRRELRRKLMEAAKS